MLLQEFKKDFLSLLTPIYGNEESQQFFYLLSETYLHFSKIDIALNFEYELTSEQQQKFTDALKRLQQQEPIQHIIGSAYFYGNTFKVTPDTLIPRPETEELIEWILTDHTNTTGKILDIGTGSGCIAISLADRLPKATVSAIDFSKKALTVAEKNAFRIETTVNFIEQDILIQDKFEDDFDIIVSNPPYVRELEKVAMNTNVLDFEPDSALFVSDSDPLLFYRKIALLIANSYSTSKKQRFLYYEINEYLAEETVEMLEALNFHSIEVKNDFRGKPRMLKAIWN